MSDIACIVKIDLTNMDAEMRSAKVNSLLKEGYEIKSTIPVTEDGKPHLLIVLEYRQERYMDKHLYAFWSLFIVLIALHVYEILN